MTPAKVFDFNMQYAPAVLGLTAALATCEIEDAKKFRELLMRTADKPGNVRLVLRTRYGRLPLVFGYTKTEGDLDWLSIGAVSTTLRKLIAAALNAQLDKIPRSTSGRLKLAHHHVTIAYAMSRNRYAEYEE